MTVTGTNRLWVDLTTATQDAGRTAHGTLRVERGLVSALAALGDPRIGFVAFDRGEQGFVELPPATAAAIAAAPTRREAARDLAALWQRAIWALHRRARRVLSPPRSVDSPAVLGRDPFASGDTLLFLSELHRHDFRYLVQLKRTKRLALIAVHYDLLRVLEDADPRLSAGDPAGLPPTDFLALEARLLLPISAYSAGILRDHLRRRAAAPVVAPIRLAGALPPSADPVKPIPRLMPGRFVLSVGDVVHRKNHRLLVAVWAGLIARQVAVPVLVIVGRIDPEGRALVRSVRRDRVLRAKILFLPHVDDGALRWLFAQCRYTAFPSLLEGFGLPVAESLAQGKVCLASNRSAIPEAGQDAAISLDPEDAPAWDAAVCRMNDPAELAAEEARVAQRFRPIGWADTASDILAAIRQHGLWPTTGTPAP